MATKHGCSIFALLFFVLSSIPGLSPAGAVPTSRCSAPLAAVNAQRIPRQLAAKDAVIVSLKRHLKDAREQIQILQKRQADDLDTAVQNYNALMRGAVEDREKCASDYQQALASPLVSNPPTVASFLASQPGAALAEKSRIAFNSMTEKVNQALVLHKQIVASPLFSARYVEKELCLRPSELSEDLRAAGAADLRFIERR